MSLLSVAVALLTIAVLFGTGLALWHLRATEPGGRPPFVVGIIHGSVGLTGLAVLLLVVRGPPRGVGAGVGSFGSTAAFLLGAALLSGVAILLRRRTVPAVMMAIHSGLAITGYVLLLAWNSLG